MMILDSKKREKDRIRGKDSIPAKAIEAVAREGHLPAGVMNWEEIGGWSNETDPGHNYSH